MNATMKGQDMSMSTIERWILMFMVLAFANQMTDEKRLRLMIRIAKKEASCVK
jgi:hypothetical protein